MSRLLVFVNILVAAFVTLFVVIAKLPIAEHLLLIALLWAMAYSGKSASAYFETISKIKE